MHNLAPARVWSVSMLIIQYDLQSLMEFHQSRLMARWSILIQTFVDPGEFHLRNCCHAAQEQSIICVWVMVLVSVVGAVLLS